MATHMPMARQPFAPLDSSRLQNLTSLKNRQNALSNPLTSPTKRKATTFDSDNDAENVDPIIFLSPKRSRAPDGTSKDTLYKPPNFFLTKAPPSPNEFSSALKPSPAPTRRPILPARSPAPRLNTAIAKPSPLSAPAGRSPTRKRIGILNRRRTTGAPFTRVDPPRFSTTSLSSGGLNFSIDAALSGTLPSYSTRSRPSLSSSSKSNVLPPVSLHEPETKDSWFFDIHEDTPEEEATNLMEHSTCTLDISSDEESVARLRDSRGKENVPPVDDVSQTRTTMSSMVGLDGGDGDMSAVKVRGRERRRRDVDENAIEVDRSPLGDLAAEDFYAEGCDGQSVIIVPADVDADGEDHDVEEEREEISMSFDFSADVKGKGKMVEYSVGDVEALMRRIEGEEAPKAMLLEPMEKAEEGFEVWESGSAKGDE